MSWIGFDIGGANIKMARPDGVAGEVPFPMWIKHRTLADEMTRLLSEVCDSVGVAVTMTGELADCFENKGQGVRRIVDAVVHASGKREVRFYRTDGGWCEAATAKDQPLMVAAANWHALAAFVCRFLASGSGFLIDIGSTTTDIIPVKNSLPINAGETPVTDLKRLFSSQLVYTGVWRSPLNGILRHVSINGQKVPLANELFATMADAYIWNGTIEEDEGNEDTADSRPATRKFAGNRLARVICSDYDEIGESTVDLIANSATEANRQLICKAIQQVVACHPELPLEFVVSGSGSWLAENLLASMFGGDQVLIRRLDNVIDDAASRSAAAYAVMKLANEQITTVQR